MVVLIWGPNRVPLLENRADQGADVVGAVDVDTAEVDTTRDGILAIVMVAVAAGPTKANNVFSFC
jgi:hypothetical protein